PCSSSPDERQAVLPGLHACPTDALYAFNEGRFSPSSAPWCLAALRQGVQTAAGRPSAQPAHHQGIGAEGEGTRLPLPGTKRAALLEVRESAPGQQKRSLGDLFRQRALVAEARAAA